MILNCRLCRVARLLVLLSFSLAAVAVAQESPTPPTSAVVSTNPSTASTPAEEPQKPLTNFVESGGTYMTLTSGFGYWAGGYSRAVVTKGNDTWRVR